jgi:hypothetical protein
MPVPALVISAGAASSNMTTVTTPGMDTTGATVLIAAVASYDLSTVGTLSDTRSNTWTPLTARATSSDPRIQLWYVAAPLVGSAHTATYAQVTGTPPYPALSVAAFRAVRPVAPLDGEVGAGSPGATTTLQPGALTPTQPGDLLVTALAYGTTATPSVNLGFTLIAPVAYLAGVNYGLGLAWSAPATLAAVNPTWTLNVTTTMAATLAAFKAAAGAPPPLHRPWRVWRRAA